MNPQALLTTIPSDSHNWNLIYMQLLLQELGFDVINLGACTTFNETLGACISHQPDIIVVSTVNGHGYIEGIELVTRIREVQEFKNTEIYIGGKLSTDANISYVNAMELELAGYTKAYYNDNDIPDFMHRLRHFKEKTSKVK